MIILGIILIVIFWQEIVSAIIAVFGFAFALIGGLFAGIAKLFD